MTGFYDAHKSGRWNGKGPVLWLFRFYRADGSFGSCQCVEEKDVTRERDAIEALGYRPLSEKQ